MCNPKVFQHEMKFQPQVFVGILRAVKSENMEGQFGEDSSSEIQKMKREDFLDSSWRVCQEFAVVSPKDVLKGVPTRWMGHKFKIHLAPGTTPIHRHIYKLSPLDLQEASTQIYSMSERWFIRPSQFPRASPVSFVPKKEGSLQFGVHYHWLNKRTMGNWYPLPFLKEMIDCLSGAEVFSKIDLWSWYWQMLVRNEDVPKTAFRMRWDDTNFLWYVLVLQTPLQSSYTCCRHPSWVSGWFSDYLSLRHLDIFPVLLQIMLNTWGLSSSPWKDNKFIPTLWSVKSMCKSKNSWVNGLLQRMSLLSRLNQK